MYLGIKTDSPVAEFYLYKGSKLVADKIWQADRRLARELLGQLETFLYENSTTFNELAGVFVYRGPGSFTGLRIGITVINSIAYASSIGLVGSEGDNWHEEAVARLENKESDQLVTPVYGADPRITKPVK